MENKKNVTNVKNVTKILKKRKKVFLHPYESVSPTFYPRDAMLARVIAVDLCLSVRVCLSQVGVLSKGMNGLICFLARGLLSTSPVLWFKEICVSTKIRVLTIRNFVPKSGLRKFCFSRSVVETCYRLSSTKVDAQSVINWTVVDQLSWQYIRAPTIVH